MSNDNEILLRIVSFYNGRIEKHSLLLKCITEILDKIRQEKKFRRTILYERYKY